MLRFALNGNLYATGALILEEIEIWWPIEEIIYPTSKPFVHYFSQFLSKTRGVIKYSVYKLHAIIREQKKKKKQKRYSVCTHGYTPSKNTLELTSSVCANLNQNLDNF